MSFVYKDYLLEQLNIAKTALGFSDITIKVSSERSFIVPRDNLLFVVKKLTGNYVLNIKTQPIQIICYSEMNTYSIAQQILDYFILTHKNGTVESTKIVEGVLIKQNYDTSVSLRPLVQIEDGYKASLYCFGQIIECPNLNDIGDTLKWYNSTDSTYDAVNYINASVSYAAVLNTTKETGTELSTSLKQEAGLSLTLKLMNDDSDFVKEINKLMLGSISGNTEFKFSFTFGGVVYTNISFKLSEASFITNRTDAPGLQLTFTM